MNTRQPMKREYEFSRGIRVAVIKTPPGKTRITIRIDDDILEWFRSQVHLVGGGNYQSLINKALRDYMESNPESPAETVRMVVREELTKYARKHPGKTD
jgi:uncharacterized protein (DUF4415 family)